MIVTDVAVVTAVVAIGKFAVSAPAATVTLAGTLATVALLLDSVTTAALAGAAVKVTVPVLALPPVTLVGLTVNKDKLDAAGGGLTVNTAVRVTPARAGPAANPAPADPRRGPTLGRHVGDPQAPVRAVRIGGSVSRLARIDVSGRAAWHQEP